MRVIPCGLYRRGHDIADRFPAMLAPPASTPDQPAEACFEPIEPVLVDLLDEILERDDTENVTGMVVDHRQSLQAMPPQERPGVLEIGRGIDRDDIARHDIGAENIAEAPPISMHL